MPLVYKKPRPTTVNLAVDIIWLTIYVDNMVKRAYDERDQAESEFFDSGANF